MPNIRLLPPVNPQQQTLVANGRKYTSTPGQVVDVPDFDADILTANGWLRIAQSGPTTQRPTSSAANGLAPAAGTHFFDETLGSLIVFDGSAWRSPVNGAAV